jgi:hypothetical protein
MPADRVRALRANRLNVDLIVSFSHPTSDGPCVAFFASAHSSSSAGRRMAEAIAARLSLPVLGRAVPMLKHTRSPAVIVAISPLDETTGGRVAQGVIDLFARLE